MGASSESTCNACEAGTHQPIAGAGNRTLCIPCAVGNASAVAGSAYCDYCPKGTWGSAYGLTECNQCEDGTWSRTPGAIRASMCSSCTSDCSAGASAAVALKLHGLNYAALSAEEKASLNTEYASDIAEACGVELAEVTDLDGSSGSVTISAGSISCMVTVPSASSVNALATALRSAAFRGEVLNSTGMVLGDSQAGSLVVARVEVEPAAFTTTTSTTSTSTATTVTSTVTGASSTTTTTSTTMTMTRTSTVTETVHTSGCTSSKHWALSLLLVAAAYAL